MSEYSRQSARRPRTPRPRAPRAQTGRPASISAPTRGWKRAKAGKKPGPPVGKQRVKAVNSLKVPRVEREKPTPDPTKVPFKNLGVALLVILALLAVVDPIHLRWEQLREKKNVQLQIEQATHDNAQLRSQLEQWKDKNYIAAQARARLGYVQPGETQYSVVDAGEDLNKPFEATRPAAKDGPAKPWYLVVSDTVKMAAEPDQLTVPPPTVMPKIKKDAADEQ